MSPCRSHPFAIGTDTIKLLVEDNFKELRNPSSPRVRPGYDLPNHEETLVSVATDAELPYTTANVFFKRNLEQERTVSDYRRDIAGELL